jgi:hypothetical protein
MLAGKGIGIDGHIMDVAEGTQVVYSTYMVIMFVGNQDGIKGLTEVYTQHLLAEIGAAVHKDVGIAFLYEG